jgi:hypothetical protein
MRQPSAATTLSGMTTTTTLVLRKHHAEYSMEGASSRLRARGGMRRGVINTVAGSLPIAVNDFWRCGVTLGTVGDPVLRLTADTAFVPDGPVRWSTGRTFRSYHAAVSRGADQISVKQPAFVGRPIRIEVVGHWEHLDLVVLSACFAVMSRRRFEQLRRLAVIGATGHGSVF